MAKRNTVRPSDGELAILQVLWESGPSSVRRVHEALARGDVRYTTTLKILQKMHEKGLVTRDESRREHIYQAAIKQAATQRRLLNEFSEKTFAGSAGKLVLAALKQGDLSAEELVEIRDLLAQKEADYE